MWLLNTHSLKLEDFVSHDIVKYAILSHRWRNEEVLFRDMNNFESCTKAGAAKIRSACQIAKDDGHKYIWIDTCCIDKSSSAELGEAINSMFAWYAGSDVCYAYLDDVSATNPYQRLSTSSWWSRCWTLQELIAPRRLLFLDKEWRVIGDKEGLSDKLSQSTSIPRQIFTSPELRLQDYCVAQKMSWAARREATRIEDYACSLLGIFDVTMPLNYGEGWKAFQRLQETIIKTTNDLTILVFEHGSRNEPYARGTYYQLLAERPQQFAKSAFMHTESWRFSAFPDLAIELKHEHLVLTTYVAKITQDIYAAFIAERRSGISGQCFYALLLWRTFDGSYVRLASPSQLLGTPECDTADVGLWSPPLGYTWPKQLPHKRVYISRDLSSLRTHDTEIGDVSRCGFEISDLKTLPSQGLTHTLMRSAMSLWSPAKVVLASGASRHRLNHDFIYVRPAGKDKYVPVCNVYFGANSRGLLLGHFAIRIWNDGRISPICIIIDGTFETNWRAFYTGTSIPNYTEFREMKFWDYDSLINVGPLDRGSFQSRWMYMGNPCQYVSEIDHFFMFKNIYRERYLTPISFGRVEFEAKTTRESYGDHAVLWKVTIEECYDGWNATQEDIQRPS